METENKGINAHKLVSRLDELELANHKIVGALGSIQKVITGLFLMNSLITFILAVIIYKLI